MVKPAMSYLDIVRDVAEISDVPVAAYQISGEYSMITAAAERGWIDRDAAILESLTSIRRAGAKIILTYWAAEVARGWVERALRSCREYATAGPAVHPWLPVARCDEVAE